MNLMDAVRSGKKFSRKAWEYWLTHESYEWGLKAEDILADDWEIEREPEVVKFVMDYTTTDPLVMKANWPIEIYNSMLTKKWQCIATEIIE